MRTRPADVKPEAVAAALREWWSFRASTLGYLPIGYGAYHWEARNARGERRFVTVDRLQGSHLAPEPDSAFAVLERSLAAAAALRWAANLDFVVASLPAHDGRPVQRLDASYAVSVFPFVTGTASDFGVYESSDERRSVLTLLARLHAATELVGRAAPPRDELAIPNRGALRQALAAIDDGASAAEWQAGPYSEPTRGLLRKKVAQLKRQLREFDAAAADVRARDESWVVTHGEPHRANLIRRGDALYLVDWDTVRLGPRERDLWMVLPQDVQERDADLTAAGVAAPNASIIAVYRAWWRLSEIATYVAEFRRPHARTEDTEIAWRSLSAYLADV